MHPIFNECVRDFAGPVYRFDQAFLRGGYLYAADKVVCVRAKQDGEDTVSSNDLPFPPAEQVFALPVADDSVPIEYPGSGFYLASGEDEDNDDEYIDYEDTDESFFEEDTSTMPVGNAYFSRYYLALLWRHGIRSVKLGFREDGASYCRFEGEGFEGILMGCKVNQ